MIEFNDNKLIFTPRQLITAERNTPNGVIYTERLPKNDSDDNELFTGDIVMWYGKSNRNNEYQFEFMCVVDFDTDVFMGYCLRNVLDGFNNEAIPVGEYGAKFSEIIKIGNIFDNSMLITKHREKHNSVTDNK